MKLSLWHLRYLEHYISVLFTTTLAPIGILSLTQCIPIQRFYAHTFTGESQTIHRCNIFVRCWNRSDQSLVKMFQGQEGDNLIHTFLEVSHIGIFYKTGKSSIWTWFCWWLTVWNSSLLVAEAHSSHFTWLIFCIFQSAFFKDTSSYLAYANIVLLLQWIDLSSLLEWVTEIWQCVLTDSGRDRIWSLLKDSWNANRRLDPSCTCWQRARRL